MYKLKLIFKAWTYDGDGGYKEYESNISFTCYYVGELTSLVSNLIEYADEPLNLKIEYVEEEANV